jgi:stage V sporulation protein B
MLITKSLILSGATTAAATKQYGLLFGCVFPLLFLPTFFTQSLTTALIPAISEASARRDGLLVHRRMDQAMRIALFVGAPGTLILFVWAEPLCTLLYHAPEAANLLKILAPVFFLHYFEAPLRAILLGLGKAATAMWNVILTNLFEVPAIVIFASKLGIQGVAVGFGFGIVLQTLLNFSSISGTLGFNADIRHAVKAAFGVAVMAVCGMGTYELLQRAGAGPVWDAVGAVSVALLAYAMALTVSGAFKRSELRRIWH